MNLCKHTQELCWVNDWRQCRNPGNAGFCAEHNIPADIEMIYIQQINEAYERLLKGVVKYRFVIVMAILKK